MMSDVLDRIKETWAEEQVESSFDDWKYVSGILKDHFLSQVEDKNKKEKKRRERRDDNTG